MSYWNELRKTDRNFSVGKEGWQVRVYWEECQRSSMKTINGRKTLTMVKRRIQVIEKHWGRNKELTADLKLQMLKQRIVAEASVDRDDYFRLWRRIEDETWSHIFANEDLRGPSLNKWLTETPTSDEFYRHMRYS